MKIVHASDLHLDSPLRGLVRYDGAPVEALRGATRRAFDNLVELCLDEQVDLLLLAGDIYDGDWRDYATGLFFTSRLARLCEAGVRVVMISGNHDAQSQISRSLRLPAGVVRLCDTSPETICLEELGICVHGQGFETQVVALDLAAGYPEPRSGYFNIGLLHTALEGRPGHDPYAPTSVGVLASKGYDYWALGHVHEREIVSRDPLIVFSGNLQGRHARETGAKGATLLTIEAGTVVELEHRALDVVRWQRLAVDAAGVDHTEVLLERAVSVLEEGIAAADGRLLAARIEIVGPCAVHAALQADFESFEAELRSASFELGTGALWVEKIKLATTLPVDRSALLSRDDPIGRVLRRIERLPDNEDEWAAIVEALAEFERALPRAARRGADGIILGDDRTRRAIMQGAEDLLLARLLEGGAA